MKGGSDRGLIHLFGQFEECNKAVSALPRMYQQQGKAETALLQY